MRVSRVAILIASVVGLAGCSANDRVLPRHALLERAREGYEPASTARASAVVSFAAAQIGKRYCWGGTGPRCFDCSGLAQSAWAWAGVRVPRTAGRIAESLPEVGLDEVRAGDILWWPGHVGIYAGNGWMIDALDSRHGVVVRPASDPFRAFRPLEPTTRSM
jgi:cell wall-associated NlpC family hydrolase